MATDFKPHTGHHPDLDGLDTARPTENSAWLVVIVLSVGVVLAAWYVIGGGSTPTATKTSAPPSSELPPTENARPVHPVSPPKPGP